MVASTSRSTNGGINAEFNVRSRASNCSEVILLSTGAKKKRSTSFHVATMRITLGRLKDLVGVEIVLVAVAKGTPGSEASDPNVHDVAVRRQRWAVGGDDEGVYAALVIRDVLDLGGIIELDGVPMKRERWEAERRDAFRVKRELDLVLLYGFYRRVSGRPYLVKVQGHLRSSGLVEKREVEIEE